MPKVVWYFSKKGAKVRLLLNDGLNDVIGLICCFFELNIIKDDFGMLSTDKITWDSQTIVCSPPVLPTKDEVVHL